MNKLMIVYTLAFVTLIINLTGCGNQSNNGDYTTFCSTAVTVSLGEYPKTLLSGADKFKKFCHKNADGSINAWAGGYRSLTNTSCGFWGSPVIQNNDLTLDSSAVDCP